MGCADNDMTSKRTKKLLYLSAVCLFLSLLMYLFTAPRFFDKYMAFNFLFCGILLGVEIQRELSYKLDNTKDKSNKPKNG